MVSRPQDHKSSHNSLAHCFLVVLKKKKKRKLRTNKRFCLPKEKHLHFRMGYSTIPSILKNSAVPLTVEGRWTSVKEYRLYGIN
jgi:hypothetical protein